MSSTANLVLPEITAQALAHLTLNTNNARIDTAVQLAVLDRNLATPPGSPATGDAYLVAASGTGAWTGKDGDIAVYYTGWIFLAPREGWKCWIRDENIELHHNGSAWVSMAGELASSSASYLYCSTQTFKSSSTSQVTIATADLKALISDYAALTGGSWVVAFVKAEILVTDDDIGSGDDVGFRKFTRHGVIFKDSDDNWYWPGTGTNALYNPDTDIATGGGMTAVTIDDFNVLVSGPAVTLRIRATAAGPVGTAEYMTKLEMNIFKHTA